MSYGTSYPKYVSVAEKKELARKSADKLRKKNPDISPVVITGTKIATTWWGKSWNDNLESYADYSDRIGRGRSYVRNGAVLDLKITQGKVSALVQGSRKKPYTVDISIKTLPKEVWESIKTECAGKIDSLQELIEGKFPKALSELFTAKGKGLFPSPNEITFNCSCPDWADMCKHVAAALYGIGARLDNDPSLFFVLRNVNIEELISETINKKSETLLKKSRTKSKRVIEDSDASDISDMFGIELESETSLELKTESKTESKTKPETEPKMEPKIKPEAKIKTEPEEKRQNKKR